MSNLLFYLRQAVTNTVRNRQRTLFVLFCIAVGVASVVSLRTVGLMIGDGLTSDLQADNRGDLVISPPLIDDRFGESDVDRELIIEGDEFAPTTFSAEGIERLRAWASDHGGEVQLAIRNQKPVSVFVEGAGTAEAVTAVAFFVEAEKYPFYSALEMLEPPGLPLAEALTGSDSVVIARRLAAALGVGVGDRLQIQGPKPLVVGGIVADGAEARLREMAAVILPFALLPYSLAVDELDARADTVYIMLPDDAELEEVAGAFEETFAGFSVSTTDELREQNRELSDQLTKLITTMGLLSLLIGGIGIINTMLVVVGRRTMEISVLKTLGLQARQITIMFLIEGLFLGIIGSALGVVLGVGLVTLLQGVAEKVFVQTLQFQIYPEALVMGFVMGVVITLVFGFLPTLAAGRVRPSVVLQPGRSSLPRAGRGLTALVVGLMTVVIGVLVGQIIGRLGIGIAIAFGAMIGLGLLTLIFRGLVHLLARLPSFGNITVKLTQRALGEHPGRAASTLLALVVGMFALSSILLMSQSLLNLIDDVMSSRLGGEIIVVPRSEEASRTVAGVIETLEGLEGVKHQLVYKASVVAINGDRDVSALEETAYARATSLEAEGVDTADFNPEEAEAAGEDRFDRRRFALRDFLGQFSITRIADSPDEEYRIAEGSDLWSGGPEEIVLRGGDAVEWLGIEVGDTVTLEFKSEVAAEAADLQANREANRFERTVTVVGLVAEPPEDEIRINIGETTRALGAENTVPEGVAASRTPFILDLEDDQIQPAIRKLSSVPGVFALEASLINTMLTSIFEKLTALPMVVALLSLFAAGVIIANSVSLAVLERQRQIGIMKAIGLRSGQVLRLLLLESGLVGLAGGVIGCGMGGIGVVLMGVFSESPGSFPIATLLALVSLAVGIALVATLMTAWGAAREKPLIVLRYE